MYDNFIYGSFLLSLFTKCVKETRMYEYMIRVENLSRFKNGIIGTRMNMNHFKCPICIEILKFRAPVYSAQFYLGQKNSKEYKF